MESFVENNQWLMWQIIKSMQNSVSYYIQLNPSDYPRSVREGIKSPSTVFLRGSGRLRQHNYNRLVPEDELSLIAQRKGYVARNFELGHLYYTHALHSHFNTYSISKTSRILVTPDGRISYCKKNLFELKKEFCTQVVGYESPYLLGSESTPPPTDSKGRWKAFTLRVRDLAEVNAEITTDDFDWQLVDGLLWDYGTIKTKHLYVYNLAYRKGRTAEVDPKPFLRSNEEYIDSYSEYDFKPEFRFGTHDGYSYFYPLLDDNGLNVDLQHLSLQIGEGIFNTWTINQNRIDPRPKLAQIRLSPMFF